MWVDDLHRIEFAAPWGVRIENKYFVQSAITGAPHGTTLTSHGACGTSLVRSLQDDGAYGFKVLRPSPHCHNLFFLAPRSSPRHV